MAIPDNEIRGFIRRLIQASRDGRVTWTSLTPTHFAVETPSGSVAVLSQDEDDDHPFEVKVANADGTVVGHGVTTAGSHYATWEIEIADLYNLARNGALGVRSTIGSLAEDLRLPPDPGPDDVPF